MRRILPVSILLSPLLILGGCSSASSEVQKPGSSFQGADKSKAAGQVVGERTLSLKASATDRGSTLDADGVCDATRDRVAWCEDKDHAVFCHDNHWYELECNTVPRLAFCGEAPPKTVECFAPTE